MDFSYKLQLVLAQLQAVIALLHVPQMNSPTPL